MSSAEPGEHFEACGFWLPCDQANFIHHDGHKALRTSVDLTTFDREPEPDDLQDQVLHRLVMVLPDWEYTYMVPVKHVSNPYGDDPDAAVFVNRNFQEFRPGGPLSKEEPHPIPEGVQWQGLALLVNSSGFYLWLLRYTMQQGARHSTTVAHEVQKYLQRYIYDIVGGDYWSRYSGWPDDEPLASSEEQKYTLEMYRKDHRGILTFFQINTIFEGLFSSSLDFQVFFYDNASDDSGITRTKQRYSLGGFIDLIATRVKPADYRTSAPPTAAPATARQGAPETADAQDLAEEHQAEAQNAHEGQSPDMEPTVVAADADQHHRQRKLSDSEVRRAAVTTFLDELDALYPHPHPSKLPPPPRKQAPHTEEAVKDEADHLCHNFLGAKGCGPLLLKFLQATASESLQNYKRRVERCRRALVGEIMEVTQRQEGVLQVEVPRTPKPTRKEGGFHIQDERILGVTEAQLRGYVLLLSAKLPLINNVRLYIDGIVRNNHWYYQEYRARGTVPSQQEDPQREAKANQRAREVSAAIAMWTTVYMALSNDLTGLEKAIRQEREDRMVQEEEKIRVEQETLAEIERLQERNAGSLSPQTTLTLGLLSNAFALASVLIALISINQHSSTFFPTNPFPSNPGQYHPADLAGFIGAVLGLGLALLALYFLAHYAFMLVFRLGVRFLRVRWTGRYYYELDIHMEAPLNDAKARELLDDHYDPPSYSDPFIKKTEQAHPGARVATDGLRFWDNVFWPGFRKPERNSYRTERQDANEAMHKVYVEVTAVFRRTHWYQVTRPRVNLVLVYEILFHRPAQTPRFILKDLRVISMQTRVVPTKTLAQIKRMIAVSFVNPLLTTSARPLEPEARTDPTSQRTILRDALMSLTRPEPMPRATQKQDTASSPEQGDRLPSATPTAPSALEGGEAAAAPRSSPAWLKRCVEGAARSLAFAGVVGFAVYLGRVIFDLINLTSASGFGALLAGDKVAGTLRVPASIAFIHDNIWMLLLGPLVIALTLMVLAALAAMGAAHVAEWIHDALTLTDAEASRKVANRKAKRQISPVPESSGQMENPEGAGEAAENQSPDVAAGVAEAGEAGESRASAAVTTSASEAASQPQDATVQTTSQTGDAAKPAEMLAGESQDEPGSKQTDDTPTARLPWLLRVWRRTVVFGWMALSWSGWLLSRILKFIRWAFRVLLGSFGIALALPIIGRLLALVGLGLGR